jgi:putative ABC transport system permease protein
VSSPPTTAFNYRASKLSTDIYPLRGELKSAPAPFAEETVGGEPQPGEAWVEARLLTALDLKIGDSIDVGMKTLKLTRVLTYEPDRAGNFYSLTPRVMINLDGPRMQPVWFSPAVASAIVNCGAVPQGSTALQTYRDNCSSRDSRRTSECRTARDGNQQIGGALGKAERYLNMASLVAVLLAGVAVALVGQPLCQPTFRRQRITPLPGLVTPRSHAVVQRATGGAGLAGEPSAGAMLGWLAQFGLFYFLHDLLPADVPALADCCRPLPGSAPGWSRSRASPYHRWPHSVACRLCAYCAATCCPFRQARGWSMAPRCLRSA